MDIKAMAEQLISKFSKDPAALAGFTKDPVAAVEKTLGVDLPDEQIRKVIDLVKSNMDLDKAAGLLSGLSGMFKK